MQARSALYILLGLLLFAAHGCNKPPVKSSISNDPQPIASTPKPPVWRAKDYGYKPSAEIRFELIHTKLEVSFDWSRQYLNGVATLTIRPHFYPGKSVILDAKGLDINKVELLAGKQKVAKNYTYDDKKLIIELGREYFNTDTIRLLIDYRAKPNELIDEGGNAITSSKGLFFINPLGKEPNKPKQIWTQGEPESNSCWFPTFDQTNIRCSQEIFIRVDSIYKTLSNGKLISSAKNTDGTRTDYWRQDKPHAPYLIMLAVGEFAIVKEPIKNREISYYVEPAYEKYAKSIFGNTPLMIDYFSRLLGYEYPWDKYSQVIVRDYVSGAMENTSASVFMEALQLTDRELIDQNWDGIIAHELFHQWFGDLVTCESWANLALNESFANYSEYLWYDHFRGREEAELHLQLELSQYLSESRYKQEPIIRFKYKDPDAMFDSHSYAKGGLVLHMLRQNIGDSAFFKSLSLYLKQNQFNAVEIHHLRLAFEEVTGMDLNWFFNQWFLSPGHPNLHIETSFNEKRLTVSIRQSQDTIYSTLFKIPLTISFWVNGKKNSKAILLEKRNQSFDIELFEKPDLVLIDEDLFVLGTINQAKDNKTLLNQYYLSERIHHKSESLRKLSTLERTHELDQLFLDAMSHPFWKIRELGMAYFRNRSQLEDSIFKVLESMALLDLKSDVRAEAIELLNKENYKEAGDLALKLVRDSSYIVVAEALEVLYKRKKETSILIIQEFENENIDILKAQIANIYSEEGVPGKLDWFFGAVNSSQNKYVASSLIYLTGKYGLKMDNQTKIEIVLQTYQWCKSEMADVVKVSAFQVLSMLEEVDQARKYKEELINTETDQKLKALYQGVR